MRKSRLSWYKQRRLIALFVAGSTARTAASLVGVNQSTAAYYFQRLRQVIHDHSEHLELLDGKMERLKLTKAILVEGEKENVVEEPLVKCLYLVF